MDESPSSKTPNEAIQYGLPHAAPSAHEDLSEV